MRLMLDNPDLGAIPGNLRRLGGQAGLGEVCRTIKNVRTVEHPQRLMAGHGHRQIVACEHLPGLAPPSLVPARLLLKATPGESAPVAEGRSAIVPLQALMEMAPLAFGWDPRAGTVERAPITLDDRGMRA
jgi:hypothetical protein